MCNLYNLTTNQQAIRDLARAMTDSLGNLEPVLDIYPDRPAPVVRNTAERLLSPQANLASKIAKPSY